MKAEFARLDVETSGRVLQAYRSRRESAGLEPDSPATTSSGLTGAAGSTKVARRARAATLRSGRQGCDEVAEPVASVLASASFRRLLASKPNPLVRGNIHKNEFG